MTIHEYGKSNAKTVVLVHPSVVMWDFFEYLIPLLEKDCHVIIPALPGYDENDSQQNFTSVENIFAIFFVSHIHSCISRTHRKKKTTWQAVSSYVSALLYFYSDLSHHFRIVLGSMPVSLLQSALRPSGCCRRHSYTRCCAVGRPPLVHSPFATLNCLFIFIY